MLIVALAALGASIVTGVLVALAYATARKERPQAWAVLRWAATLWAINAVLDLLILYFARPALSGPYGGWQWLLWPLLLSALLALGGGGLRSAKRVLDAFTVYMNGEAAPPATPAGSPAPRAGWWRRVRPPVVPAMPTSVSAGAAALALVLVLALGVNGLIAISTTWFAGNAQALADLAHVTTQPASQALPPADINMIPIVTQSVAFYEGQEALSGGSGGSNGSDATLGADYHTNAGEYVLQTVQGHLYWIAPLVANNVYVGFGQWQSPGYVAVDAVNPNAPAVIHTGFHLRYLSDAVLNANVQRHVYLSGYTHGDLQQVIFLVNGSWQPYYAISYMRSARGFAGSVLQRVLVVDPQSGAITSYAPAQAPAWVETALPGGAVMEYLTWWGADRHARSQSGQPGAQTLVPAWGGPELVYTGARQPQWLVPMTPTSDKYSPIAGVALYNTRAMAGRFYPLTGIGATAAVSDTFAQSAVNLHGYLVGSLQLYSIYGVPTWVVSYVQPAHYGDTFEAVGLMDARQVGSANIILQPTKGQALVAYAQWLADHHVTTTGSVPAGNTQSTSGQVTRIATATEQGSMVYSLSLAGPRFVLKAPLSLSAELPLARVGDEIRARDLATGASVVMHTSFDDLSAPVSSGA